jgi:hypothetical protein
VDEAAAELARVEAQNEIELTSKNAERLNQRRQLQIRQDRLDNLRRQFAACTMIAPSDGLVVYAVSAGRGFMSEDQPLQVGRSVRPRETLVVLPDTSEMVAVVKVHESLAGRIRPGQSSSVRIDMLGQSYGGRVDSIGVMAETGDRWRDPNRREYSVRIALSHGDQRDLRPSMRCEATVTLGRVDQVVAVPVQAVFSSDDQVRFVYTPRNGRFARVPVRVGRRSDVFAEIAAGLSAGDRVLLRLPTPGEVITEAWNREALKVAGVEVDAEGNPVVARPANMQAEMPGMNAGGGAPTGADAGRFGGREGGRPGGGPNGERRGNRGRGPRNGESANGNDREGTTGGGTDGTNTESTEKPTESTEKPADSPTRGG